MNYSSEQLLRFVEGTLSADEARAIESSIAVDSALAARVDRMRALQSSMASSRASGFGLGFTERVLARMRGGENADDALYRALGWVFRRAAIASLIAAVAFGALNIVEYRDGDVSTTVLESIFGLPTVSLGDAIAVEPV